MKTTIIDVINFMQHHQFERIFVKEIKEHDIVNVIAVQKVREGKYKGLTYHAEVDVSNQLLNQNLNNTGSDILIKELKRQPLSLPPEGLYKKLL